MEEEGGGRVSASVDTGQSSVDQHRAGPGSGGSQCPGAEEQCVDHDQRPEQTIINRGSDLVIRLDISASTPAILITKLTVILLYSLLYISLL